MRSISQIYSEAVSTRNNYLQITELDSGRSNSKLSIINLLTYVMAVIIHTYETILDIFQVRVSEALEGRINGTPDWYTALVKKFQYDPATSRGDELVFNEDTLKVEYETVNLQHRIISQSAWEYDEADSVLIIKVCKNNSQQNKNNGVPYSTMTDEELLALRNFIDQVKFVGATIRCVSLHGDILYVTANSDSPIFYDDRYITASQAIANIQKSLIEYVRDYKFNKLIYYQDIIDVLQNTEHIVSISSGVKVQIRQFNNLINAYGEPINVTNRQALKSGWLRLQNENQEITISVASLNLVPYSQINQYLS